MSTDTHHLWTQAEIEALFAHPWLDLMHRAAQVHRAHWPTDEVELATLLSVKTGGCPENCGYCPQAQSFDTGVQASKLMATEEVLRAARAAQAAGATRFCMGAAWRSPISFLFRRSVMTAPAGRSPAAISCLFAEKKLALWHIPW